MTTLASVPAPPLPGDPGTGAARHDPVPGQRPEPMWRLAMAQGDLRADELLFRSTRSGSSSGSPAGSVADAGAANVGVTSKRPPRTRLDGAGLAEVRSDDRPG